MNNQQRPPSEWEKVKQAQAAQQRMLLRLWCMKQVAR